MRWSPRAVRIGVICSFAIPALIIGMSGLSQAQPRPPIGQPPRPPIIQPPPINQPPRPPIFQPPPINQPPIFQPPPINQPPINPPRFENIWSCGKCRRDIGTGAFPPATCPHCGVRIINGVGGGANPPPVNPPPFNPQPPINIAPPPINVAPPPPNVGNDTEPELAPHTRPARSNTGLIIGLVVGGVVFAGMGILVIGGGVYVLMSRQK
jgi:hypothetical protein